MRRARSVGISAVLGALALGSAAMYWLDPQSGKRRRGQARDKALHLRRETRELVGKGARDLRHRAMGAAAEARRSVTGDEVEDDAVLVERVRAEMGHACSHPHAIEVQASNGGVTLRGPVLAPEADEVCLRVAGVPGVRELVDELERHESAEHVPALQGGRPRRRQPARWRPSRRLLGAATGALLLASGLARGRSLGRLMTLAGAGLLARSATNRPPGRGFELQKTLVVRAPLEEVFSFLSEPENFPRFMQHVRRVHRLPDGRWHWVVDGPAGAPVHWDAEVTCLVPNQALGWRTIDGEAVNHEGMVRLEPADGSTRIHLTMCYRPVAGLVGQAIATMLGASPKRELDEDMLRFKSLVERGKTRAHGAEVTRDEVQPAPAKA